MSDGPQRFPELWYGEKYNLDKYVEMRYRICVNLIRENCRCLPENVSILDIGGYTGKFIDFLKLDNGMQYYDVDLDLPALKTAKSKGAYVLRVDLQRNWLPLHGKFDIVVMTEVLEHLQDPEKVLHQVTEGLLSDNGLVLISLPNECTLYHRLKCLLGKGIDTYALRAMFKHLHFPTIRQEKQFVERHLRIIGIEYWAYGDVGGIIGRLSGRLPYSFWGALARVRPSLFARGVIFLGAKRTHQFDGTSLSIPIGYGEGTSSPTAGGPED